MAVAIVLECASCTNPGTPGNAPAPTAPSANAAAVSAREAYELSEKCGKEAREWFRQFYGNGEQKTPDYTGMSNYTNHYNPKLNQCFALVATFGSLKDAKTHSSRFSDVKTLVQVNENKEVGTYFKFSDMGKPMQCSVADQPCDSQEAWEERVKLYMEE